MKPNDFRAKYDQRGITLISVAIIGILLVCVLIICMRCVPVVNEYLAIKRAIYAISTNADATTSDFQIQDEFDRRAIVESISTIKGTDLDIKKQGGKTVIAVDYGRKVPLVANVSLLFEFKSSTLDPQ